MKYVVGFSGGIDSQAAALWALNRYPREDVVLLNSDAGGNEHPITIEFIEWYAANVHPVMRVRAEWRDALMRSETIRVTYGREPTDPLTFGEMGVIRRRFPSRRAQFCTEVLKLRPSLRWVKENVKGPYRRVTGLRRDESESRKTTPPVEWDEWFGCRCLHPIFDWTKQMCFDFCKAAGQKVNELYMLGFTRVGCAPCINSGREDIRRWSSRFPEMIDKVRRWEKTAGHTFFAPMVPGKTINWIDEVVEWANCVPRSGGQYALEVLLPTPVCESKFGLCG